MINISELRVGNYVNTFGTNGYPNDWVQIKINAYHILTCESKPELFAPIPLSEEWLLRCGGLVDETNTFISIGSNPEIRLYKYNDAWICANGIPEIDMIKLPYKLLYIHELQNILSALKKE